MFPFYKELGEEDFLTFIGQFYAGANVKPSERSDGSKSTIDAE